MTPSEETRIKLSQTKIGSNNPNWKGYDYQFTDFTPLHQWLRRRMPKPLVCPICKIQPPFDLANITGVYNREFKNWQYLCRHCHMSIDYYKGLRKLPQQYKKK